MKDFNVLLKFWKEYKVKTQQYPLIPLRARLFYEIDDFQAFKDSKEIDSNFEYNLDDILNSDINSA